MVFLCWLFIAIAMVLFLFAAIFNPFAALKLVPVCVRSIETTWAAGPTTSVSPLFMWYPFASLFFVPLWDPPLFISTFRHSSMSILWGLSPTGWATRCLNNSGRFMAWTKAVLPLPAPPATRWTPTATVSLPPPPITTLRSPLPFIAVLIAYPPFLLFLQAL